MKGGGKKSSHAALLSISDGRERNEHLNNLAQTEVSVRDGWAEEWTRVTLTKPSASD